MLVNKIKLFNVASFLSLSMVIYKMIKVSNKTGNIDPPTVEPHIVAFNNKVTNCLRVKLKTSKSKVKEIE